VQRERMLDRQQLPICRRYAVNTHAACDLQYQQLSGISAYGTELRV
jgi:hypothetical protein